MSQNNYAIEVSHLSKSFKLRHEKTSTLFEHLAGMLKNNRKYETLVVLNDISFNVKKGEMFGIIGKNGEGKTTLLRILSGIFKPDSGHVKRSGSIIPFTELGAGLQPELTARENIVLYGILLGFSKKEIIEKVPEIIQYAELEKFADTKVKNFSTGMQARLAFSTAIQVNPDILLVDEVLSVGDVAFQEKSFQSFLSFKKQGKTIVFVSHNLDQIKKLCDTAMMLHKGKIQKIGHPVDVVDEYLTMFGKKPPAPNPNPNLAPKPNPAPNLAANPNQNLGKKLP